MEHMSEIKGFILHKPDTVK